MVSSMRCMLYKLVMGIMSWWDWSHGAAADLKRVLQDLKLWPLQIIMLVCNNVGFGPKRDEMLRLHQAQAIIQWLFQVFTAETCDLSIARAPDMPEELGAKLPVLEGMTANQSLWMNLKGKYEYPRLGYKTRMAQFLVFQERNSVLLGEWTERLFKAELLSLECGWLNKLIVK